MLLFIQLWPFHKVECVEGTEVVCVALFIPYTYTILFVTDNLMSKGARDSGP